jgi:putative MATE family efflux protein
MTLSYDYKTILKVAAPLMLGTFIQSLVAITDASFLSRYSTISFDASGNAGLIYVTLFMGLNGLGDAAQIIMARRIGKNEQTLIAKFFQSSLLVNICLGLIFFLGVQFIVPNMLLSYSNNMEIAHEQVSFLNMRSLGFFAAAIMLTLNAYFMAIGKTWVIFLSTIVFALSNVAFDYLLIFGNSIFPALGVEGAAIASVIAELLTVVVLFVILIGTKEHLKFGLFKKVVVHPSSIKRIFKVGTPLMIQGFFALATWTVFFTWIEQMGTYELTVSQNIRAIYFLAFVPIFGFGATTRTYISQYVEHSDKTIVNKVIRRIQFLTLLFLFIFFHGAIFYPEQLILVINPNEIYLEDSVFILRLVAGSILIFGISTPLFQTVNGSGNTLATLMIEFLAIIIYILTAYTLIKVFKTSITYVWLVEYIYFGSLLLFSWGYLKLFDWRKKKI